jgi:diguanylate cyclase (GGDEF)-like protein/PAS domain S-box-containing protein
VNQGSNQANANQRVFDEDTFLQQWRRKVLDALLIASILFCIPSLVINFYAIPRNHAQQLPLILFLGIVFVQLVVLLLRNISLTGRAYSLVLVNVILAAVVLIQGRTAGAGEELLIILPVCAIILLGLPAGLGTSIISLIIYAAYTVLVPRGWFANLEISVENLSPFFRILYFHIGTVFLLSALTVLVGLFFAYLSRSLLRQEKTTRELEKTRQQLEEANQNLEQISESRSHELRMAINSLEKYEKHLADIISFLPDPMFVVDAEGKVQFWNRAMEELTGVPAKEIIGKGNYEHALALYGERRPMLIDMVLTPNPITERVYPTIKHIGKTIYAENYFPNVQGKELYLTGNASPLYNAEGEISGAIEIIHDITERVRASEAERKAHQVTEALRRTGIQLNSVTNRDEVMKQMLEAVDDIIPSDVSNILVVEDDRARPLLLRGYEDYGEEVRKKVEQTWFDLSKTANLKWIVDNHQPLVIPDTSIHPDWIADKTVHSIRSWVGAPIISQGQVTGILCLDKEEPNFYTTETAETLAIFANQAALALEKARLFEEVQLLAITDSLTGLFNRRHFFSLAEKEFERSLRYQRPLALLMLDLDEFKEVNDRHGHLIGDQVLQTTSVIIRQSLRKVDICGRYGGEEFVILMPETDHEKALQAAERLRQTIAEFPILLSDENISVTTSIGVACCDSQDDLRLEMLLNRADEALYQAKHLGRNRVCVWERKQIPPFA